MTRPFSLTMQAHRLDLHRLWLVLLAGSILMALAWAGWATSDQLVVYETSARVDLSSHGTNHAEGHAGDSQQRWFEARFPMAARESLAPGQKAVIFVQGKSGEETFPALITETGVDPIKSQIRVILRADFQQGTPDPFDHLPPKRVRVSVGARTPLELWLPELAPSRRPPSKNSSQLQR